jgi:LysM repeat protein
VDWAAYWGVAIAERAFFQQLPKTDDPETGFVGSVYDAPGLLPPRGYGVYAEPVAALLRANGLQAEAQTGASSGQLESEIASGRPVIVWFLYGFQVRAPVRLTASDGQTYPAARFEHTGILIGYDPGSFTLVEAFSGRVERVRRDTFLASWAVLGNQAVFGSRSAGPTAAKSSSASPASQTRAPSNPLPQNAVVPTSPGGTYLVRRGDTLTGIARRYGLSWTSLASLNRIDWPYTLYPGQRLLLPAASSPGSTQVHVVQPGESLSTIARAYGLPWSRLAALNGLPPPYHIYPGQVIRVP